MANRKKSSEFSRLSADQQRKINSDELRTHMANERTFLAWCRTSLALVVFGFVLSRFELFVKTMEHTGIAISTEMMSELRIAAFFSFVLAGAIILISGWRFLHVRKKIIKGEISVSIFPEIMVILSMISIIVMVTVLLSGTI